VKLHHRPISKKQATFIFKKYIRETLMILIMFGTQHREEL